MTEHIKATGLFIACLIGAFLYFYLIAKLPAGWGLIVATSPLLGMGYYACLLHVREKQRLKS